jgi:acylphosphatase
MDVAGNLQLPFLTVEYRKMLNCQRHSKRQGAKVKSRAHVFVSGFVQGVFFRSRTKQKADSLNVKGWVRNLPDDMVEAVFEGEEDAVKTLVSYCRDGPGAAVVTKIDVEWEPFAGEFRDFEIRYY